MYPDISRPAWKTLADELRERIRSGALKPGEKLVSEERLQRDSGLSRTSIRRAIDQLRAEGLVTARPAGTMVLAGETLVLGPGDEATVIDAGTVVLCRADGGMAVLAAGSRIRG
jgi:GntR family transcriptional regulator